MKNSRQDARSGAVEVETAVRVLLSEKEYADAQIAGNFASNARIIGTIFTVVVTGLGWVFAADPVLAPDQIALVLLSLVAFGSVGLIMAALSNGFASFRRSAERGGGRIPTERPFAYSFRNTSAGSNRDARRAGR